MHFKALLLVGGLVLGLGQGVSAQTTAPRVAEQGPKLPGIDWKRLDQGFKAAQSQKRPVFVMVYADWCGYCKRMDATTFKDSKVATTLNSKFVPVRLNGESETVLELPKGKQSETDWAQTRGISGFPTLVFLDAKGKTITQIPSYLTPPQMLGLLDQVLAYLKSGSQNKGVDFDTWSQQS